MNVSFGSQIFSQVQVPLLWGSRAIISHPTGEYSVIDLSGDVARPEIIKNIPAPQIEYVEREDGIVIFKESDEAFFFSPARSLFRDISTTLPECEIRKDSIRIGNNTIGSSMITGFQVGIGVSENGMFIGGPLPSGLAALRV